MNSEIRFYDFFVKLEIVIFGNNVKKQLSPPANFWL